MKALKNIVVKDGAWSIAGNILQNILLSIFFIVLAREYSKDDFSNYLIANTIYTLILGFSTLGLGNWFIRELLNSNNEIELINRFFKIQLYTGIVFYIINIIISFYLYESNLIRTISIILGLNIIIDNLIYVIKYINISRQEQKKSSVIITIEALLKFILACIAIKMYIPIVYLTFILILLRIITLNLFIQYGSSDQIQLKEIIKLKIPLLEIKKIVLNNWLFVVIGSISVLYWSIGNIIISKNLSISVVANYGISFKLLSLAYTLPIIASSTIYPIIIKKYKSGIDNLKKTYKKAMIPFSLYGILAFTFVNSYAHIFIPLLFGTKYANTAQYCIEMFLVMLVFPTAFLQANVLIAIKLEKIDMICNLSTLIIHIAICSIGLKIYKSLSVINYSILISFFLFHLIQDYILIKNKISSITNVASHYIGIAMCLGIYSIIALYLNKEIAFVLFWVIVLIVSLLAVQYRDKYDKKFIIHY